MSDLYGPADDAESIATIHAALDAGVDPARHRRLLRHRATTSCCIREALRGRTPRRASPISVKFGALRGPEGSWLGLDGRPAAVKNFARLHACAASAPTTSTSTASPGSTRPCRSRRPSAPSPSWSRPATSATSACPRSAPTPSAGPTPSHPIADLQIEYSLISRGIEDEILPVTPRARHRHHGVRRALPRPAQRPLDRASGSSPSTDFRSHSPRFQGENLEQQPRPRRGAAHGRRRQGRDRRPGRHRLGALPGRGHRAARRRAPTRAAGRGAGRARRCSCRADDLAAIEAAVPASAVAGDAATTPGRWRTSTASVARDGA